MAGLARRQAVERVADIAALVPHSEGSRSGHDRGAGFGSGWVRPRPARSGLLIDLVVGVLATVVTLLGVQLTRYAGNWPPVDGPRQWLLELTLCALVVLPLCIRRRLPQSAALCSITAYVLLGVLAPLAATTFMVLLALFCGLVSATAWAADRRALVGTWGVALAALAVINWQLLSIVPVQSTASITLTVLVFLVCFGGARLIGESLWRAARSRALLTQLALTVSLEQRVKSRHAVLEERLRIARDLHDVSAHYVSLTGIQAAAARRVLTTDPAAAAAALTVVEDSSRAAVTELREMLGVLRDPEDFGAIDAICGPGIDEVGTLVDQIRSTGLQLRLQQIGDPADPGRMVSVAAYRLIQEALVNVGRHSTASRVRVTVRWPEIRLRSGGLQVEVVDNGRTRIGTGGSGLGHLGMRERAGLVGGDLEIGHRKIGGYRVFGRFPLPQVVHD